MHCIALRRRATPYDTVTHVVRRTGSSVKELLLHVAQVLISTNWHVRRLNKKKLTRMLLYPPSERSERGIYCDACCRSVLLCAHSI